MTESYTYIKNAKIIDGSLSSAKYGDILIKNAENGAKIVKLGKVELPKGAKIAVTDAKGAYACPGFVDLRAHLCAKGSKRDALAVAAAARAGGYSGAVLCPDTLPTADTKDAFLEQKAAVNKAKTANFALLADLTVSGLGTDVSDIKALLEAGAVGFYDEGTASPRVLRDAMRECAKNGCTLFVKCAEKTLSGGVMNEGERARQMKMSATPAICEELALAKYLMLAKDTGCRLHVHCVSTKGAVQMIRQSKKDGVRVTCDTCPQYFSLTDDQILFKGSAAKVDPPLRGMDDVMAVIEGIADGTIDAISTDHTPCDAMLKRRSLADAPFGMIMLETAFLVGITTLVEKGHISIYRLIDAMCHAPMRILGMDDESALGINLFSMSGETYASKTLFAGNYSNSPFEGWHFSGKLVKYFPCDW